MLKEVVLDTLKRLPLDLSEFGSDAYVRKVENALYNYIYAELDFFKLKRSERKKLFFAFFIVKWNMICSSQIFIKLMPINLVFVSLEFHTLH